MNNNKNDVLAFFIGLAMLCVGGYLFANNVEVSTAHIFTTRLFGRSYEGVIFIPLIASIVFLFYKYNWVSKTCCGLSLLLIVINVIINLRLHWQSTNLFVTIIIFILLFGGLGLVMKTLFANPNGAHGKNYKTNDDNK